MDCFRLRLPRALSTIAFVASAVGSQAVAAPEPAPMGVYYATLGNNAADPGALITIDPATGAGTLVGPTGIAGTLGDRGVPALAIRSTGEIFAMDIGTSSRLYQLDALTGAATLMVTTTLASPPAIAYDGADVLWVVDNVGKLYTLDETTGVSTLIGSTGAFIKALAFDPTTGVLWGSDASSVIYTINVQTGIASAVGNTGLPPTADICFDAVGTMYGSSGGGLAVNNLITIDRVTGAGQVVGSTGFVSVSGMATRHDKFLPVAIRSYEARWVDGHVEVSWRLIDMPGAVSSDVLRAERDGSFIHMSDADIVQQQEEFVFVDAFTEPGREYRYRVIISEDGEPVASFETAVTTPEAVSILGQNRPNPFNPLTVIPFSVARSGPVRLAIYDSAGHRIRTLLDSNMAPGNYTEEWNGRDDRGRSVASGVYFYRLTAEKRVLTGKAVLLK